MNASSTIDQIAQSAIYWEDLPVGTRYGTSSRTITEADVAAFFALRSGQAQDAFLPGILTSAGFLLASLVSILTRWPAVGFLVGAGDPRAAEDPFGWRRDRGEAALSDVQRTVRVARSGSPLRRLAAFLGPGYLVAVGYMDPGNWATSLAGGSEVGYTLLVVALVALRVMDDRAQVGQAQVFQAARDDVDGGALIADKQHPLAAGQVVADDVGDGLTFARSRGAVDHQGAAGAGEGNSAGLAGIGRGDEALAGRGAVDRRGRLGCRLNRRGGRERCFDAEKALHRPGLDAALDHVAGVAEQALIGHGVQAEHRGRHDLRAIAGLFGFGRRHERNLLGEFIAGETGRHLRAGRCADMADKAGDFSPGAGAFLVGEQLAAGLAGLLLQPGKERFVGGDAIGLFAAAFDLDPRAGAGANGDGNRDHRDGRQDAPRARGASGNRARRKTQEREAETERPNARVILVRPGVVREGAELGQQRLLVEPSAPRGGLLGGFAGGRVLFIGAGVAHPDPGVHRWRGHSSDRGRLRFLAEELTQRDGRIDVLEPGQMREVDALTAVVRAAVEAGTADDRGEKPLEHSFEDSLSGLAHGTPWPNRNRPRAAGFCGTARIVAYRRVRDERPDRLRNARCAILPRRRAVRPAPNLAIPSRHERNEARSAAHEPR